MTLKKVVPAWILVAIVALATVACSSDPEPTEPPEPAADPTSASDTAPASMNDQEKLREIPALLLADPLPNPAVQATLWNDYLRNGVLRSLDGMHSLNVCARSDGGIEGTATGDLVSGEEWSGGVQLENPDVGWESAGLLIGSDIERMRAYLLRVVDGEAVLAPNSDPLDHTANRGIKVERVALGTVPFEVHDGAVCGIKAGDTQG